MRGVPMCAVPPRHHHHRADDVSAGQSAATLPLSNLVGSGNALFCQGGRGDTELDASSQSAEDTVCLGSDMELDDRRLPGVASSYHHPVQAFSGRRQYALEDPGRPLCQWTGSGLGQRTQEGNGNYLRENQMVPGGSHEYLWGLAALAAATDYQGVDGGSGSSRSYSFLHPGRAHLRM
jgi:hypothetical protein